MHLKSLPLAVLGGIALIPCLQAEVSVPTLFSDHMVLQREKPIRIWGWADPGEAVNISLDGISAGTLAGEDGTWQLQLPALPAGGPYTMRITGSNELVMNDVLIGEVWIASGQSNMQWVVGNSTNADLARLTVERTDQIRFNRVRNQGSQEPRDKTDSTWEVASAKTISRNTAVGYAFASTLHDVLGVPIGIIDNAWGGSTCEAWVDRTIVANDPALRNIHENWLNIEANYDHGAVLAKYEEQLEKWKVKAEQARLEERDPPRRPNKPQDRMTAQHRPGNLWNGRVLPIAPVTIRGAIWYQGEGNSHSVERAMQYHHLFSTMIGEWRKLWGEDFPFYFVQLADFKKESTFGPNETWAFLRESQTKTLQTVPKTGQAVIIDIGEGKDIHPQEKEEVGRRLARWALNQDYGFTDLSCRSPEFKDWEQRGDRVIVTFNHTGKGLRPFDTNTVRGFVVRDDAGDWHIVEGKVRLKHNVDLDVAGLTVTAIRYAWANNPVCNLFSMDGLPLTPFRTDSDNHIMQDKDPAAILHATDRAFSERAQEVGTAQAFTEFAAADAVMYRDRSEPIEGREAIGQLLSSDQGSSLVWEPIAGDIAASGDLGYTRGKFVYHTAPAEDGTRQGPFKGYYTSIWKKQADGTWKWVYDGGIISELPPAPPKEGDQ
jgi:sialate O-acetylesterase